MTTIGYATLQLIPVLAGVTEEVNKQLEGKTVPIKVEPKVDEKAATEAAKKTQEAAEKYLRDNKIVIAPKADPKAAEDVGKATKETVEKHTKDVKVTPKADPAAAEKAGKDTGDAVTKGVSGSTSEIGKLITKAVELAAAGAGREAGKMLAEKIPEGMTGLPGTIGELLRKTLPSLGAAAGAATAAAIGTALSGGLGTHVATAGTKVATGLVAAVNKAEPGVKIAQSVGTKLSAGMTKITGAVTAGVANVQGKISTLSTAIDNTKELLGGEDSWAAPGLDFLKDSLGKVTPLLTTLTTVTETATAIQAAFDVVLSANPIGAIVIAVAALVAGLIWFFTQTEIGQKIWEKFTEYLKTAWAAIKDAFQIAWGAIKIVWETMVTKAGEVWQGIKTHFTALVDFVKELPGKISNAAKGMWDGLKNGLVEALNWIADKWNAFADGLSFDLGGVSVHFPHIPHFPGGGYTGNAPFNKIAGVVHGDEHVIKSTSRRTIENAYPGLLDYMNNMGRLPGFAGGGRVSDDERKRLGGGTVNTSILQWLRNFNPDAKLTSGYTDHEMDGGYHPKKMAIDVDPSRKNLDYVWANRDLFGMIIYDDPQKVWYNMGGQRAEGAAARRIYGEPTMRGHGDHIHLTATQVLPAASPDVKPAAPAPAPNVNAAAPKAAAPDANADAKDAAPASSSSSFSMPSTISGLSSWGLSNLNVKSTGPENDYYKSPERTFELGTAAAAAVEGQVSSALGGLGVLNSPSWLNAASTFVKGIKVGGSSSTPHAGSGAAPGGDAAPAVNAARNPSADAPDSLRTQSGPQRAGSVTNYNIRTSTVEDSFLLAQRREKELAAMILSRF